MLSDEIYHRHHTPFVWCMFRSGGCIRWYVLAGQLLQVRAAVALSANVLAGGAYRLSCTAFNTMKR